MVIRPSFSAFNAAYGVLEYAVICGYLALQSCIRANGAYLLQGELGRATPRSSIGSTVSNFIRVVILGGVPAKIANVVIPRVAVMVATFHAPWPGADERGQDQRMRPENPDPITFPQRQIWPIVPRLALCERLKPLRLDCADAPAIRDFIDAFKPHHGEPFFHADLHTNPSRIYHTNSMGIKYVGVIS